MKKHWSSILLILIFLVGLGVLLYPTLSDYFYVQRASRTVTRYRNALTSVSQESYAHYIEQANAYNDSLRRLMPEADELALDSYEDMLDITGTGVMGYITIQKIRVNLPVYHGTDDETLMIGIGHMPGTSLPVGGMGTHCALSGHSGQPSARLFTDLEDLEIGDTFVVTVLDQSLTYEVDQIKVVLPSQTEDLRIQPDRDLCTLITCTPYGVNSHRLLVRGSRVEGDEGRPTVTGLDGAEKLDPMLIVPIVAMVILLMLVLLITNNRRKRRSR